MLRSLAGSLIFLFPLLFAFVDHWGSTIYTLLALLVCCLALMPPGRALSSAEKRLFLVVGLFMLSMLVTYLLVDQSEFNYSRLRRYGRLLLIIPIVYVLIRLRPNAVFLWYGIALASIVTGVAALFEWSAGISSDADSVYRVQGGLTNELVFGHVAAAMAVLALAGWSYFKSKPAPYRLLSLTAIALALLACFLSGTRGAWLALIVAVAAYLPLASRGVSRLRMLAFAVVAVMAMALLYAVPQTGLEDRIEATFENLEEYDDRQDIHTSIGARIEMWRVSWQIFTEHPLIGAGASEFKDRMLQGIHQGRYEADEYNGFSEPHSSYMAALSSWGLFGFTALLLMLAMPLAAFVGSIRKVKAPAAAIAGAMYIIVFALLGLTAAVFDMTSTVSFFSFYLGVLMFYSVEERLAQQTAVQV